MTSSWMFMKVCEIETGGKERLNDVEGLERGRELPLFLTHSHDNSQVTDLVALAGKLCFSSEGIAIKLHFAYR